MAFKVRQNNKQIQTQIKDKLIDPDCVSSMRLAVYHNTHKNYVAEVDVDFKTVDPEWGDSVKLRNDLYTLQNIQYKLPSGWRDLQPWYELAIQRAKTFADTHGEDYHCKLGKKWERWYTIPCTFFSYAPSEKLALLQLSIPTDQGLFDAHVEIEVELEHSGKENLHYNFVDNE